MALLSPQLNVLPVSDVKDRFGYDESFGVDVPPREDSNEDLRNSSNSSTVHSTTYPPLF